MVVDLCNNGALHTVAALRLYNGVGEVKRNSGSSNLSGVDTVAAYPGSRINNGDNFTSCLQEL